MVAQNPFIKGRIMPNGCIEWPGQRFKGGYGKTMFRGKTWLVHRKAWAMFVGEIPAGLCVLHKCDNPACFNTGHLYLGTHAENAADRDTKQRGGGPAKRANTTHCARGHAYTAENTYIHKNGAASKSATKRCRTCVREKVAAYKARIK